MSVSIAVVSTHADYIAVMTDLLADKGYQVIGCLTSEGACETIQRTRPALVLLDLWLEHPRAGELVLAWLHHDHATQDTPVIVCLEDQRDGEQIRALLGEKRCAMVLKPFAIDMVLALIKDLIQPSVTHDNPYSAHDDAGQASQVNES